MKKLRFIFSTIGLALVAASCDPGDSALDDETAVESRASTSVACKSDGDCTTKAQFCQFPAGTCGGKGQCAPRPRICPLIFAPVCGCDDKTYGNACQAAAAGVSVKHTGACVPPPKLCESNDDCAKDSYCAHKPGACAGTGTCKPRPQICPQIFDPVCGCDRQTYPNACQAAGAGVSVAQEGACPVTGPFCGGIAGIPCPGAGKCVDDPSDDCDPNAGGADCGGLCTCPAAVTCKPGSHFDGSPAVCACVPDRPNPCATVLCAPNTICVVQNGQPVCVPTGGESCGGNVCGPGQFCCNASCGICAPKGGACIQIVCNTPL